ncbi:hypothetical protein Goklo_012108 [Gossypium klotzschianum]|uniref:Uncharacterized protein n=1 Tax=Gossypium klotzschianum TaxID=34286 RepID=A0A7J8VBJ6_9ROSI|nr:hypothetical protein [Gossypium klotzschianum]
MNHFAKLQILILILVTYVVLQVLGLKIIRKGQLLVLRNWIPIQLFIWALHLLIYFSLMILVR